MNFSLFQNRHISTQIEDLEVMLNALGVNSIQGLINETIPENIRLKTPLKLEPPLSEFDFLAKLKSLASKNEVFQNHIGMGFYGTKMPTVIQRNILENPGWYTQYTPYQAEIAQGRLEAILNYQTLITDLTGMEVANASLLDESTAAAEAMHLSYHVRKKENANQFLVLDTVFPQTIEVLKGHAEALGIEITILSQTDLHSYLTQEKVFGVLIQYPDVAGSACSWKTTVELSHENKVLVTFATDLLSLCILTPPGEWGADIVIGSSQRFGLPMGYGGPHAGFFAIREEFKRNLPGRIIGVSVDVHGNKALRMALQTREQHIRRDKATSNICTAQALPAILASMYAVYHGPEGLKSIAQKIFDLSHLLANIFTENGIKIKKEAFFDTIFLEEKDPVKLSDFKSRALDKKINVNYRPDGIGISMDELCELHHLKSLLEIFLPHKSFEVPELGLMLQNLNYTLPLGLTRSSHFLLHPTFNTYHTEHAILRYMKKLENKDLSLVHSMIPLGSCTMKLNGTTEMIPLSWPEWNALHPFAPVDQSTGYQEIFKELEKDLCSITGFDAFSLQPNSGAQGEYAGLKVIQAYHQSRGDHHRNLVLIPSSAHGTNPASAVMAGFQVMVIPCDSKGNIDLEDLRKKAKENAHRLAGLMVTYPSTHGVFEIRIQEICSIIHQFGGQVYMDGANMNAQVGLTSPAMIGADVCHLNLHKTFCIPHGGGGPGMGPIGVVQHLTPFLPGHALIKTGGNQAIHAVSEAPWGSASILLISYAYIKMMGSKGLTLATQYAILHANYMKYRLEPHFPILYIGDKGRSAHEIILDCRSFKNIGVEVADIAKRLMDYGFHAPTVSFPVAGTLMIEPTESESLAEIDRYCDALIQIRKEIQEIEMGLVDKNDNVLKNAPHTAQVLLGDDWEHEYSRSKAAFPLPWIKESKFWPSVGRINETQGDRVLICTCPPIEEYAEEIMN